jgi:hypothetical protein
MSITTINDINNYINNNNYEYFFFQITKSDITKNTYLENYLLNTYYNSNYVDINNETIYNYFYNISPTYTSILYICIKELYIDISNAKTDYVLLRGDNDPIDNSLLIQNFIENKFINVLGYVNSTYDLTFIQLTKTGITKININNILTNYTNYQYKDISNNAIFNYYNRLSTKPMLLIIIKEFLTTLTINKTDYLFVDNALNNTSISNYINNKVFLNLITIPTAFDIQFLQIVKNNMNLITTPITNIISSYTNKYIVTNSYRTIISTQTFNYFSNGSKPILIVFIRDYFSDEINKNNSVQLTPTSNLFIILKNYYIEIKNKLKFIQIDSNTTLFTLESFIQNNLISMPINSLNYLKIYLKYTLYELTFIRLLTTNINSIKSSYIISFLNEANIIYKKNVEFIEIIGNIEINDFYNTLVRNFPAILFFKRSFYTTDRYRVPCKILSGENYYTNKSIPRIKLFIKTSLNY